MYYKFWENRGFGGGTPIGANLLKTVFRRGTGTGNRREAESLISMVRSGSRVVPCRLKLLAKYGKKA